ncbi:uncharacterized protein K452DRAFT_311165 [Aplosporella prunicola CBS 121167]|uniref:Uncharacterized protein n=1 Tax=Aplosporella prunicola CBS 121167 TaxID=1176127 RepID=A0A6A6B3P4_9PEZI|nr:uncharacterized protein K452DRAFT_311165 [Aplosporella prunicola CBS 121167]KAF2138680.1 hypothetical protein K452DRAFT_311165 [Aplosporella prunicola CBS 121167]
MPVTMRSQPHRPPRHEEPAQPVFRFLGLPAEPRVMIYEYALQPGKVLRRALLCDRVPGMLLRDRLPGILKVCRLIYKEALDVFYKVNVISVYLTETQQFRSNPTWLKNVRHMKLFVYAPKKQFSFAGHKVVESFVARVFISGAQIHTLDLFFIDHTISNYSVLAGLYSRALKPLDVLGNIRVVYHVATNQITTRAVSFGMNALKNIAANPANVSIALVSYDNLPRWHWHKVPSVMNSTSKPWSEVLIEAGFVVLPHRFPK